MMVTLPPTGTLASEAPPEPDRSEALRFVNLLTGSIRTPVTVQTFVEPKDAPCELRPQVWHGPITDLWDQIVEANLAGHYIGIAVNETDGVVHKGKDSCRTAENVRAPRALWLDEDPKPGVPPLTLGALALRPSFVVQSGRGLHVYWRLKPGQSLAEFTPAQKGLAAAYNTDASVSDVAHVMRLPGTLWLKDRSRPFLVTISQVAPEIYSIAEVVEAHGVTVTPVPINGKTTATAMPTGGIASITRARAYTDRIPGVAEGSRNSATFRTAAVVVRDFAVPTEAALSVVEEWNMKNDPPLPSKEVVRVVANAARYGKNAEGSKLAQATNATMTRAEDTFPTALQPASVLFNTVYPPLEFVCRPYIPKSEVIEIVGPHGSFKSTIALDLCLAVACGRSWGGVPVTQGRSAFITLEDREVVIAHRVRAYLLGIEDADERAAAEQSIRDNFAFISREQAHALALTMTDRHGTSRRDDAVKHITGLVTGRLVVILETASRLSPGPETNEALATFASSVEFIVTNAGTACGVVRHVPKAVARETDKDPDSYWGRGGGAFADAARSVLNVRIESPAKGEKQDPLAPVRLTQTKPPPFSSRGDDLLWKPTLVDSSDLDGPVFLRSMERVEVLSEAKNRLYRHLCDLPDGLVKSDLRNNTPAGLKQAVAVAAMEALVEEGRATVATQKRGKTGQRAVVFRAVSGS
jgi:hypothetical protein